MDPQSTPQPDPVITRLQQATAYLKLGIKWAVYVLALLGWLTGTYLAVREGRLPTEPIPVPVKAPAYPDDLANPVSYEGCRYHGDHVDGEDGDPQHLSQSGRPWPTNRITYSIDYASAHALRPALPEEGIRGAFRQAWNWITEDIELEAVEVPDAGQALVQIRFERIDGTAGVLAESYLSDGTMRPKTQRYDLERWTTGPPSSGYLSLSTVACHELIHVLGLGHDDENAPAVMRPMYTAAIPREQPRDIDRLVQLGYKRRVGAKPGGTGGNAAVVSFPVSAKAGDLAEALRKIGAKVDLPK